MVNSYHKICIGTVQFGIESYGINNETSFITEEEIKAILSIANEKGIQFIDTAEAYGSSQKRLGRAITSSQEFKVVTKLTGTSPSEIKNKFFDSLKDLNTSSVYGVLLHAQQQYEEYPAIYQALIELKEEGLIEKIGFSTYEPNFLEKQINKVPIDLVQIPYNLLDRRMETVFPVLKQHHVEIHARSVFLQGLFFKSISSLSSYFRDITPSLSWLQEACHHQTSSIAKTCIQFALSNQHIDQLVLGFDTREQFEALEQAFDPSIDYIKQAEITTNIKIPEEKYILPYLWK